MSQKKNDAEAPASGAPRWTYALGAIVGAAALLWTIVSTFIPKSDAAKPVAASAPGSSPGSTSVTVSGSGSVGVGNMSGGSVTVGAPSKAADSPAPPAQASAPR